MTSPLKGCDQCGRHFEVKFSFQALTAPGNKVHYFCSQNCRLQWTHNKAPTPQVRPKVAHSNQRGAAVRSQVKCDACTKPFEVRYAFQRVTAGHQIKHFCSMECRSPVIRNLEQRSIRASRGPQKIAILNQKGGTGKTTTSVNLCAGLAKAGKRTLAIDLDAQGHVGVSLGAKAERTLYHLMVEGKTPQECASQGVRENLDMPTATETLAAVEIFLARKDQGRERILRDRMKDVDDYEYVILDCGPSLSLLNMNALTYADQIIIPVSCDFLSLVGVKQILKTLKNVNQKLMHPISIMGILPTFYDRRNRISNEAVNTLRGHFKDKVLPPVRINTRLKEAPSHKQSIFEYASDSHGARDYQRLVDWVIQQSESRKRVA